MRNVSVAGKGWGEFNAAEETVDIGAEELRGGLLNGGAVGIAASFS